MSVYLRLILILIIFAGIYHSGICQNTIGVTHYDGSEEFEGYTLLYPLEQADVYLIDYCGRVVHEWTDSTLYVPGNSVYLLSDGNLLKTKKPRGIVDGSFSNGGSGGIVEMRSWDNELLWSTSVLDGVYRAHHDVEIMPNGNVLIIAWQRRSKEEYIEAGGDTLLFDRDEIWPDLIQEYDPNLDSIVWTWDSWDHLVQDVDPSKDNFGVVSQEVGRIDLNYDLGGFGGRPDWIHSNAIDYNEELDQILLSASHFEELWIIDHSTTAEEAKTNQGGLSGKGGSLLFRWGNPRAYKLGEDIDKRLFFQHDAHWIDDPYTTDDDFHNMIGVFNNRVDNDISSVIIIDPVYSIEEGYDFGNSGSYLLKNEEFILESSTDYNFQSSNMSSFQILPNGNFFICASQRGKLFEITKENELIWEYVLPFRNGFRIQQGSNVNIGDNVLFRARRYPASFNAFIGKSLVPKYFLELDPSSQFCDLEVNNEFVIDDDKYSIYPNPVNDNFRIVSHNSQLTDIKLYNYLGHLVFQSHNGQSQDFTIDMSEYSEGIYYLYINGNSGVKILVIH